MKIKKIINRVDEAAYDVFENMSACSKSLIMGGLIGGILVAICAVLTAVYIINTGYTLTLGNIFETFLDRSAAIPAIALFFCLVSELTIRK